MPKNKLAYITLLDQYHPGIFDSQVIDVCAYLNNNFEVNIQLIAFLSIKELRSTDAKKTIKSKAPNALVLPAFPKIRYFNLTRFLLYFILLFKRKDALICRGVFATQIGLAAKKTGLTKKVIFDGRSALAAEIKEYDVFPIPYLRNNIAKFEKRAVLESDFRIAVSEKLITYWAQEYNYNSHKHVVIPCTLQSQIEWNNSAPNSTTVKVVYAGSNAPWQGFDKIIAFLRMHPQIQCTLLTKESDLTKAMHAEFKERLKVLWVKTHEVPAIFANHDYGLLLRPQSVTNQVASPGKFAEYLACGLNVIITENLGDYTGFVEKNNCGFVWDEKSTIMLKNTTLEERKNNVALANQYFLKNSDKIHKQYITLVKMLH